MLCGGGWLLSVDGTCHDMAQHKHPNVVALARIGDALTMNSGPGWGTLSTARRPGCPPCCYHQKVRTQDPDLVVVVHVAQGSTELAGAAGRVPPALVVL